MSIIDTSDLEVEEQTTVELDDKNGNELMDADGKNRRSITMWGPGSRPFVEAQARAKTRNMKRMRTHGGRTKADADADLEHEATFLAEITVSFNHFGLAEDQQTRHAFKEFYKNPKVGYITQKVNAEAGDWANF